jgi:hypothetical protein
MTTKELHQGPHDCKHDCSCFWCRVSRKEKMPTIEDTMTVTRPAMEASVHWETGRQPYKSLCGLESWTMSVTQDFMSVTCKQCLERLEEGLENK